MSFDSTDVTITIDNNIWYVSKYCPKSISYTERSKDDIEPIFPWEYKMNTGQFRTFASALGLEVYYNELNQYGKIDPEELIYLLDTFIPELAYKPEMAYTLANGEEVIEKKMDQTFIEDTVKEFYKIAKEADRRRAMVLWC